MGFSLLDWLEILYICAINLLDFCNRHFKTHSEFWTRQGKWVHVKKCIISTNIWITLSCNWTFNYFSYTEFLFIGKSWKRFPIPQLKVEGDKLTIYCVYGLCNEEHQGEFFWGNRINFFIATVRSNLKCM